MARCRSCGAGIRWARTEQGKSMPLDERPTLDGNVAVVGGQAHVYPGPDEIPAHVAVEDRFMPHHATCPSAEEWRR